MVEALVCPKCKGNVMLYSCNGIFQFDCCEYMKCGWKSKIYGDIENIKQSDLK